MTGASAKRKQHRLGIELLETRTLLSGSSLKLPIVVADVAPATPLTITAELAPKSDPDGNGVVLRSMVTITGQTVPGARVRLEQTVGGKLHETTKANAQGKYHFTVRLPVGQATFQVECTDKAGQTATTDLTAAKGDVLIDWNTTALNAVRAGKTNPPLAARNLAMVQLAVYDAVNSIDPLYQPYGGIRSGHAGVPRWWRPRRERPTRFSVPSIPSRPRLSTRRSRSRWPRSRVARLAAGARRSAGKSATPSWPCGPTTGPTHSSTRPRRRSRACGRRRRRRSAPRSGSTSRSSPPSP